MSKKDSGGVPKKLRRANALKRLLSQLSQGTKINKEGKSVELTTANIARINKEIVILKTRV